MGALTSRQHVSDENAETIAFSQYRYPPKNGRFFQILTYMNCARTVIRRTKRTLAPLLKS